MECTSNNIVLVFKEYLNKDTSDCWNIYLYKGSDLNENSPLGNMKKTNKLSGG